MEAPKSSITCPVCRQGAGDLLAVCSACETPHHPDCWEFARGCAVFACGEDRARLVAGADLLAALARSRAEPMVLDDSTPEPDARGSRAQLSGISLQLAGRGRESEAVMLVSWAYLAASLVMAIPAVGYLVGGLTGGEPEHLGRSLACGAAALGLKRLGDLIAIGDGRGRSAHLYGCLGLALVSVSLGASLTVLILVLPFWTRRGQEHFVRRAD